MVTFLNKIKKHQKQHALKDKRIRELENMVINVLTKEDYDKLCTVLTNLSNLVVVLKDDITILKRKIKYLEKQLEEKK